MKVKAGIGHFLGITLLLAGASRPAASQSVSSAWVGDAPIVESVDEIMARDAAIASSSSPKVPVRPRLRRTLAGGAVPSPAAGSNIARSPQIAGPLLPQTLGTSFLAVQSSESAFIPPDTMGCVGPTQILVCVNGRIKLFDRSGTLDTTVLNVTTDSFFSSVRGTTSASDCRVRFDPDSKRWFVVMINTPSTNNRIMIAVSKTATITSSSQFFFY